MVSHLHTQSSAHAHPLTRMPACSLTHSACVLTPQTHPVTLTLVTMLAPAAYRVVVSVRGWRGLILGNTHRFPRWVKMLMELFCAKKSLFNGMNNPSPHCTHAPAWRPCVRLSHLSLTPHFHVSGKQCNLHSNPEFTETALGAFIYSSEGLLESPLFVISLVL